MLRLDAPNTASVEIKRSRFVARALTVMSPEQALDRLAEVGDPEATHNCWAYRIGDRYRFSDDGEPGGTAGRPILAAIEGQGVDRVLVVVTRYFGGTKLGAGGLVRAYGGVAAECLRTARTSSFVPTIRVRLEIPFDGIGAVYNLLSRFDVEKLDERFTQSGAVLSLAVPQTNLVDFEQAAADATRGSAEVTRD